MKRHQHPENTTTNRTTGQERVPGEAPSATRGRDRLVWAAFPIVSRQGDPISAASTREDALTRGRPLRRVRGPAEHARERRKRQQRADPCRNPEEQPRPHERRSGHCGPGRMRARAGAAREDRRRSQEQERHDDETPLADRGNQIIVIPAERVGSDQLDVGPLAGSADDRRARHDGVGDRRESGNSTPLEREYIRRRFERKLPARTSCMSTAGPVIAQCPESTRLSFMTQIVSPQGSSAIPSNCRECDEQAVVPAGDGSVLMTSTCSRRSASKWTEGRSGGGSKVEGHVDRAGRAVRLVRPPVPRSSCVVIVCRTRKVTIWSRPPDTAPGMVTRFPDPEMLTLVMLVGKAASP